MTNKINQLIENLKKEYEDEVCITDNLNACYYILPNGEMLSIGYDYGCRSNDHRAIFCACDIKYNDWTSLHKEYNLVGYVPETGDAWIAKGQELTEEQSQVIEEYGINLMVENF